MVTDITKDQAGGEKKGQMASDLPKNFNLELYSSKENQCSHMALTTEFS